MATESSESVEERLPGGRLTAVYRVDDTVRRPRHPWSEEVQRLLAHLRGKGFGLVPEPLGFDEQGREVLGYIPSDTTASVDPWPGRVWSDELLADVGRTVASFHRAVADIVPTSPPRWDWRARELQPGEIICHRDFAHYNAVFEGTRLVGMIDWDSAGPSTIGEELAFIAWQWVPLVPPDQKKRLGCLSSLDEIARLRLLLDSYGFGDRGNFIAAVIDRIEMSRAGIEENAANGDPRFAALRDEGYTRDMELAKRYLEIRSQELQHGIE